MKVSVSILDCDFLHLGKELRAVEQAGVDSIHLDVMDGRFVKGISFGRPLGAAVRRGTELPIHSHLMVVEPERQLDEYLPFSQSVIFHIEAATDPDSCIRRIRKAGIGTGVSLNPDTPVATLKPWLPLLDDVLVMSVFPGRGGQSFIAESPERIRELRRLIVAAGSRATISVDGGIKPDNAGLIGKAGADVLISGSAVFRSTDYAQAVSALRSPSPSRQASSPPANV